MPAQHRRRRNRPTRTPSGQDNPWRLSRFALHGACDVLGCHGGRGQHSALYRCLARTEDAVAWPIAPRQWGANRDRWASVGERETPWLDLLAHAPCCDIAEMTHGDTSATGACSSHSTVSGHRSFRQISPDEVSRGVTRKQRDPDQRSLATWSARMLNP